jgi:hypothetical protein
MMELKASELWEKPDFVLDIIRLIRNHNLPFFIEIVDKKFFLCMHIITSQLLRPFPGGPENARTNYVRNELAEHIYRNAPGQVFEAFVAACNSPSDSTLRAEFAALLEFSGHAPDEEGRAQALRESVMDVLETYETESREKADAYRSFLPSPDASKRAKPVWLLPNLASLMNIYARINLFEGGNLSGIALIHDEQAHFDEILQSNKTIAESLGSRAASLYTPYSDFHFLESASLNFTRSVDSPGIQVADILAGFCMRYAKSVLQDSTGLLPAIYQCFHELICASRPDQGIGINQVMTSQQANNLMGRALVFGETAPC